MPVFFRCTAAATFFLGVLLLFLQFGCHLRFLLLQLGLCLRLFLLCFLGSSCFCFCGRFCLLIQLCDGAVPLQSLEGLHSLGDIVFNCLEHRLVNFRFAHGERKHRTQRERCHDNSHSGNVSLQLEAPM